MRVESDFPHPPREARAARPGDIRRQIEGTLAGRNRTAPFGGVGWTSAGWLIGDGAGLPYLDCADGLQEALLAADPEPRKMF